MDTSKIIELTKPISEKQADYTKGNRFFNIAAIQQMPKMRIVGNLALSFLTKLSTGYWRIFDPNNGFTAISQEKLRSIPLEKIDNRYFFESDMLFRLHLCDVIVKDIPLPAIYKDERSNLKIKRVIFEFPLKHLRNFAKRIVYSYYLRDFNLASLELPLGIMLAGFGSILGVYSWIHGIMTSSSTATGTLILISISSLAGLQLLLAFFSYDSNNQSR